MTDVSPTGLDNEDGTTCWLNCLIQIFWACPDYINQFKTHLPLRTSKLLVKIYEKYAKKQIDDTSMLISVLKHGNEIFPSSFWRLNEEQDVNEAFCYIYSKMNEQQYYCFDHLGMGTFAFDEIHQSKPTPPSYCKHITLKSLSYQQDTSLHCHSVPKCKNNLQVGDKLWYIQTPLCIQRYLYRIVTRIKEVEEDNKEEQKEINYSTVVMNPHNNTESFTTSLEHVIQINLIISSSLENPTLDTLIDDYIRVINSECSVKGICESDQKLYEYQLILEQTFLVHKPLPRILPIVLLRNQNNETGKYEGEINMPFQYNFYRFFHPSIQKKKQSDFVYELYGFIRHLGSGTKGSHYISFIKIRQTQKWYLCNDTIVHEMSVEEIQQHAKFAYSYFYLK
jgi:Ubiquitin carboxyl-terminal hydrolase